MTDVRIENPILNSPFAAPVRHWEFGDTGITKTVNFETEWTKDRMRENTLINQIRDRIGPGSAPSGDPYEKLKRAMKAEIDEAAWASLYRTTSRPFDRPTSAKIAIKVINHYGDEVLKVFDPRD